jgi:hypothetical protein
MAKSKRVESSKKSKKRIVIPVKKLSQKVRLKILIRKYLQIFM